MTALLWAILGGFIGFGLGVVVIACFAVRNYNRGYEEGYTRGDDDGYDRGYANGFEAGGLDAEERKVKGE